MPSPIDSHPASRNLCGPEKFGDALLPSWYFVSFVFKIEK